MLVYQDIISGDELLSDSFEVEEVYGGILYKVPGKWVTKGPVDVDIGANASAEGGEDDSVDDAAVKVVDIVDTFRLQEQASFDKKSFVAYIKGYIKRVAAQLPEERKAQFEKTVEPAVKFLLSKIKDLQYFTGESMNNEASLAYALYDDGAAEPTFYYFKDALKEVKC